MAASGKLMTRSWDFSPKEEAEEPAIATASGVVAARPAVGGMPLRAVRDLRGLGGGPPGTFGSSAIRGGQASRVRRNRGLGSSPSTWPCSASCCSGTHSRWVISLIATR